MKRISSVLILIVGVVVASFVTLSSSERGGAGLTTATESGDTSRFSFLRQGEGSPYPSTGEEKGGNLTNSLTQAYLEEVIKRNPSGPQLIDDIPQLTVPSEETFQELLASYLNTAFEWEKITEKDVKTSDGEDSTAYLEFADEILNRKTKALEGEAAALSDFLEKGNETPLRKAVEELHTQLREVLAVSSPPVHEEFHLRLANLLQLQVAIYTSVLKTNDDPVRAVLAINEFPKIGGDLDYLRAYVRL